MSIKSCSATLCLWTKEDDAVLAIWLRRCRAAAIAARQRPSRPSYGKDRVVFFCSVSMESSSTTRGWPTTSVVHVVWSSSKQSVTVQAFLLRKHGSLSRNSKYWEASRGSSAIAAMCLLMLLCTIVTVQPVHHHQRPFLAAKFQCIHLQLTNSASMSRR